MKPTCSVENESEEISSGDGDMAVTLLRVAFDEILEAERVMLPSLSEILCAHGVRIVWDRGRVEHREENEREIFDQSLLPLLLEDVDVPAHKQSHSCIACVWKEKHQEGEFAKASSSPRKRIHRVPKVQFPQRNAASRMRDQHVLRR